MRLKPEHPALIEARTIHPKMVREVSFKSNVIKRSTNTKLGKAVTKGRFKGFPIYGVTLQERATCPSTCIHWDNCYGNNMAFAHRFEHGAILETKIQNECASLAQKHPNGFLVRLHILGDFYSVEYVELWDSLIKTIPALHVFGYTARQLGTEIGHAIYNLNRNNKGKAQIRYSNNSGNRNTASSLPTKNSIQCPQQTGKTANCGTCSYCWETTKPVYFATH